MNADVILRRSSRSFSLVEASCWMSSLGAAKEASITVSSCHRCAPLRDFFYPLGLYLTKKFTLAVDICCVNLLSFNCSAA